MKRFVGRIPWESQRKSKHPKSTKSYLDIVFFFKIVANSFWSDSYKMTYYNVFLKMIFIIGMNYFYRFIKIFKVFEHFVNEFSYIRNWKYKIWRWYKCFQTKMVYLYSLITPGSNPDFLNFYLGSFVRIKSLLADLTWPYLDIVIGSYLVLHSLVKINTLVFQTSGLIYRP